MIRQLFLFAAAFGVTTLAMANDVEFEHQEKGTKEVIELLLATQGWKVDWTIDDFAVPRVNIEEEFNLGSLLREILRTQIALNPNIHARSCGVDKVLKVSYDPKPVKSEGCVHLFNDLDFLN